MAYGEIAAANALSDVFAMGGRVLFALSIAAFPEDFPKAALAAVFEAAAGKVREAGGILAGGHTIRDAEPKYGLAVIGAAHPDRLFRKGGAHPGDVLLLTKRLGTGLLVSGRRAGRTTDAQLDAAIAQMRTPQPRRGRGACGARYPRRDRRDGVRACWATVSRWHGPRVSGSRSKQPRCRRWMARWTSRGRASRPAGPPTTGGSRRRRSTVGEGVAPELVALAHDPQTSGGLLAAIPAADAHRSSPISRRPARSVDRRAGGGTRRWRARGCARWPGRRGGHGRETVRRPPHLTAAARSVT